MRRLHGPTVYTESVGDKIFAYPSRIFGTGH